MSSSASKERWCWRFNHGDLDNEPSVSSSRAFKSAGKWPSRDWLSWSFSILLWKLTIFNLTKRVPFFFSRSRYLRNRDRDLHYHVYPKLFYPELYLLEGGYKAFFAKCKVSDILLMSRWVGLIANALKWCGLRSVFTARYNSSCMIRYEIICNQVSTVSVRMLQKRSNVLWFVLLARTLIENTRVPTQQNWPLSEVWLEFLSSALRLSHTVSLKESRISQGVVALSFPGILWTSVLPANVRWEPRTRPEAVH